MNVGSIKKVNFDSYETKRNDQINQDNKIKKIRELQPRISIDDALYFCKVIDKRRVTFFKEAQKSNSSRYIHASRYGTARPWQVTPNNHVIIHFTKSKENDKTYFKGRCAVKEALNYDTLEVSASVSGTFKKLREHIEGFEMIKGIKGFAELQHQVKYQGVLTEKLRLTVTLGDRGDLHIRFVQISYDKDIFKNVILSLTNYLTNLHQKGMLYRDLKPTNVVISSTQGILIIDPETICYQRDENLKLRTTYWYASPEILEAAKKTSVEITNATTTKLDVWSFGCMLYSFHFKQQFLPWFLEPKFYENDTDFRNGILKRMQNEYKRNWFPEPADKNSFEHLIWEMLQYDPKLRPEMVEIQQRVQQFLPLDS